MNRIRVLERSIAYSSIGYKFMTLLTIYTLARFDTIR